MTAPVCRYADGAPCPFNAVCHESRRALRAELELTGTQCWAWHHLVVARSDLLPAVTAPQEPA